MKKISKASILLVISLFLSQAFAAPISIRDTLSYNLDDYALHTIVTVPVQANEPVYSWRTHIRFDGTLGNEGQTEKLIGYTDSQGVLSIFVPRLPHWGSLCGFFINERVAVGSPSSVKSNALNFTIKDQNGHVGPLHPPIGCEPTFDGNDRR